MTGDWGSYWDGRALIPRADPFEISGFESRTVDTRAAAAQLSKLAGIVAADRVLEVGCGAGLLGRHLVHACSYLGSDRSGAMASRAAVLGGFPAVPCAAHDLPFPDASFDVVFAWSVFHYFPDRRYARLAIHEMKRVARRTLCVADLPKGSSDPDHLVFDERFFRGWRIEPALYEGAHRRFTAVLTRPAPASAPGA